MVSLCVSLQLFHLACVLLSNSHHKVQRSGVFIEMSSHDFLATVFPFILWQEENSCVLIKPF